MSGPSSPSISEIRKVRICPEHACKIFEAERLWGRGQAGEFRLKTNSRPINPPRPDYNGKLLIATEEHYLIDDRYPPNHVRYIVLRAHCFRLADGTIGASGKVDPKEMLIGNVNYRQLEFKNPHCDLCEGGDMIPPMRRFHGSRYRPGERRWHRILRRFRSAIVEWRASLSPP